MNPDDRSSPTLTVIGTTPGNRRHDDGGYPAKG